jgi:hyperosmotically inducible periplasmic protein
MFRRLVSLLGIAAFVVVMAACSQSDPGVTAAVKTKFAADDTIKAYKIDVDTKDGVVTLAGTVDTAEAKSRAVEVARNTKGVVSVTDQLAVAPSPGAPPVATSGVSEDLTDPAITAAVKTKLLADPFSPGIKIDVDTSRSVVKLTGSVRTSDEKARAEQIAKDTKGVSSVVNDLKIVPKKD